MNSQNFYHATKVVSGAGTIQLVGKEALEIGAKKVLIITDSFLAKSDAMKKIIKSLEASDIDYAVYKDVRPNPRDEDCGLSTQLAKKEKVDAIIGLGGGSSMDQCKATAALVTNGGTCRDWDGKALKEVMLPVICIPTTSGTGSEVTFVAVITDSERKYKMSIFDPVRLIPKVAITDPEITLSLPPSLTASTGIDALTHAIEAYTCKAAQPITDAIALYAIEQINKNVQKAVEKGYDLKARASMMNASTMAGIAFINSNVGAVHAISETIGAWYDTPHGVCNSIFLPHIFKYNIPADVEKHAMVASKMGVDPIGKTKMEIAEEGVSVIKELCNAVKIPKLKELKYIKQENFFTIAQTSAANLLSQDNARDIDTDGYLEVLCSAFQED